ncbi:MAG: glycoside hydrolase, partial [Candidatus Brocadiia bacterium]
ASLKVAEFAPNPGGLYDMHGNVEEWCSDWYGPYEAGEQTDPVGRVSSEFRVSRGGSHGTLVKHLRSANRMGALPADKHWLLGFRVVMGETPTTEPLPAVRPKLFAQNVSQTKYDWKPKVDMSKPYFNGPDRYVLEVENPETIPMYAHNHLSCIKYCDNGDLLTTWFSVTSTKADKNGVKDLESNGERGREMNILASRLRLGNDKWDIPSEFYKVPDRNMTGSALINDGRGRLHFFQGVSVAENWNINNILVTKTSDDNGATWSPTRIIQAERGTKPCQPIDSAYCADDGRLIVPTDSDADMKGGASGLWISEDRGETWVVTEKPIEGIHAGAVDFGKGKFMALGRSKARQEMPKSVTNDNGKTWQYSLIDLPSIGGGQRCVLRKLKEGPLLLVSFTKRKGKTNNTGGIDITDASGKVRKVYGMFTALSFDNGETWVNRKLVTTGGPAKQYDGGAWTKIFTMDDSTSEHMGYMAGIQTPDGVFHLISSALHYQFNYAWLTTPMATETK